MTKVDYARIDEQLQRLDAQTINDILNKACSAGGRELRKQAVSNLQASGVKTNQKMIKGISSRSYKMYCMTKVHIMGNPLLHIFEKGTYISGDRKYLTKNKVEHNTGAIQAHNFFETAKSNDTVFIQKMYECIDNELKKLLQ